MSNYVVGEELSAGREVGTRRPEEDDPPDLRGELRAVRRPAVHRLPRQGDDLPRLQGSVGPCRRRLPEAGRRAGRQRRPLPAQHAALPHRLLRHPEGRRPGGELQPARCRARARVQDRRQRDRHPGHARRHGALSEDGRDARQDAAQEADRRLDRRLPAVAQELALSDRQEEGPLALAARRLAHVVQGSAGERRQVQEPSGAGRTCGTRWRCCNTPAARPACPRRRC